MTEKQLAAVIRGIAPVIRAWLEKSQRELAARLDQVDTRLEGKAGDLTHTMTAVSALVKDYAVLRERIAVVEVRPVVPGPPGDPGPPGKDGADGKAGLTYQGVYQDGKSYDPGDVTTWAGSTWHCHTATTTKPGEGSPDWQLMVKRGRDGKDAK